MIQGRYRDVLRRPVTAVQPSVQAFLDHGEDWLTADTIGELVEKMNDLTPEAPLDPAHIERQVVERDRQVDNGYTKDTPLRNSTQDQAFGHLQQVNTEFGRRALQHNQQKVLGQSRSI